MSAPSTAEMEGHAQDRIHALVPVDGMEPHVTNPSVLLLVTMAHYASSLMCVSAQKDGQEVSAKQQSASHPVEMEEFVQSQECAVVLRGGKDTDAPYVPAQNPAKMEGTV